MAKETNFPDPPRGHIALLGWDSVNERWQALVVDASGLAQVDIADVADRQVNVHGYDDSAWQKLSLLWGYTDRLSVRVNENDASEGSNTLDSTAVPAGEVWVVQVISAWDSNSPVTSIQPYLVVGANPCYLERAGATAAAVPHVITGEFCLKEDDLVRVDIGGCTAGDNIRLHVWGYKMKIAMT